MYSVQMVRDHYDIVNNPKVKSKYPILHEEVCRHDRDSHSSWYSLSGQAFDEYQKYVKDSDIDYFG